ncbi:hypothetical protein R1sor_023145 [Riccia sorocarpa]|uniref:Replitron HUH endonuclease domain-containing protein n=1 Tax=Riccia sorocarpa TaxID=122646 RepID=A0ABD3GP26_9MARC
MENKVQTKVSSIRLIPVRTTYEVGGPFPSLLTITELITLQQPPAEFRTASVTEHFGSVGIPSNDWREEPVDWFVDGIEFATIRRLERGKQVVCGPFRVRKKEGKFITLEAADGTLFSHPLLLKKQSENSIEYLSTAASFWTRDCLCEKNDGLQNFQCLCQLILQRDFCLRCPDVHKRQFLTQQKQDKEEARLKQTTIDKMPPPKLPAKLKGTAKSPTVRKPRTVTPKELDISLTVGIPGQDVSNETFDKLAAFIEENARMGMICFERGDAHLLLHIQGMLCIKSSSTRMLKQQIRKAIGWADEGPVGGCICVKSLKDKGLHTIVGIIGYCLKDEKEAHFRMFQKNVTQAQMEEGRRMHWIHGASEIKNRLQLTPQNVLTRVLQFRKYRARSPVSTTFRKCLKLMLQTGQFIPALKWTSIPQLSPELTIKRTERLWMSCVAPQTVSMDDVDQIFFGYLRADRYYTSTHRTELMLMDARNGDVKVNPLHDPDMPMLEAENDDNDDPEDVTTKTTITAAENEDENCEEIVDVDAYVRAGYQRDEVTRDLLEAGYTVLFREAEADAPQSPKPPSTNICRQ